MMVITFWMRNSALLHDVDMDIILTVVIVGSWLISNIYGPVDCNIGLCTGSTGLPPTLRLRQSASVYEAIIRRSSTLKFITSVIIFNFDQNLILINISIISDHGPGQVVRGGGNHVSHDPHQHW